MAESALRFDVSDGGTLARVAAQLGGLPREIERAKRRAWRKLMTWLQRQVLRAASQAAGMPQRAFKASLRFRQDVTAEGIDIWIGTDPIAAHRLGKVTWRRAMRGARVGRRTFPGAWSWGPGSKTGPGVMFRPEQYPVADDQAPPRRGSAIDVVRLEIHEAVVERVQSLEAAIGARLEREMLEAMRVELLRDQGVIPTRGRRA